MYLIEKGKKMRPNQKKHKRKNIIETPSGDYIAACRCGWVSEPKPIQEIAIHVLDEHIGLYDEGTKTESSVKESLKQKLISLLKANNTNITTEEILELIKLIERS